MIRITGADGIRYIIDGERYWPEEALKEALGCKDDDIFGEIKKLREGNNTLMELHVNHISMLKDYADLAFELGIGSGDAESIKDYIASLKEERDELKEKCDKLKKRANAAYGASCGYSASKEPAFLCDVISYTWNLAPIAAHSLMDEPSYCIPNDSIRVELELTPTANYKGTIDPEDLKQYIQAYGREKKLSDFEVFCKLVDDLIDELCDKYNVVQPDRNYTTKERLDYVFRVIFDYRELANNNFNKAEGFRKEKRAVEDSLAELRAKIREIYRSVVDDEWNSLSYTSVLNDINEEYKRVVHNFEERTADWSKAQQELDRYRLAIGSLLDIPKESRDDINAIERSFTFSKKKYESLKEFRNDVAKAVCSNHNDSNADILKAVEAVMERAIELQFNTVDKDEYDKQKKLVDKLARLRSNICTALGLGGETSDEEILKRVMEIRESHDKLARLRSNICSEFSLVPENCDGNIIGHIHMMQDCHDKLREFRDAVAKAIGIEYPTTNPVILSNVKYIYKDREDAYGMVSKLNDQVTALEKAQEDLKQKFVFQSGLRRTWHARYESEHERANCVQKALDREREKCRVKDISLETAKKQYEKVCGNLETAECALNGMKSKIRELQEELNAERHSNLTEDNETHPIDTDPGYLRSGEEDSEE